MISWIIYAICSAIIFFVTFRACEWGWNKIKIKMKKRNDKKSPELEQVGPEQIIIERVANHQPMQQLEQKEAIEKNVIVNNYSFGGGQ